MKVHISVDYDQTNEINRLKKNKRNERSINKRTNKHKEKK